MRQYPSLLSVCSNSASKAKCQKLFLMINSADGSALTSQMLLAWVSGSSDGPILSFEVSNIDTLNGWFDCNRMMATGVGLKLRLARCEANSHVAKVQIGTKRFELSAKCEGT